MAVTLVAARLGAIGGNEIFGQLLGINCAIPIIMVAALMIGRRGGGDKAELRIMRVLFSWRVTWTDSAKYYKDSTWMKVTLSGILVDRSQSSLGNHKLSSRAPSWDISNIFIRDKSYYNPLITQYI